MVGHSSDGHDAGRGGAVRALRRFAGAEDGSTAMEYGLIASLVALGIVAFLNSFSESLNGFFRNVANALRSS